MRVSSVLLVVVALMALVSLLSIWFYPSVQDFMAANNMWNGIRDFSSEFQASNIDSLDELPDSPGGTTSILVPYIMPSDKDLEKVRAFVNDGGTLLLMDDYGYGNSVLAYLGLLARFDTRPLLDPLFSYKNQRMPRITDFAPEIEEQGIEAVVLNHATALAGVEQSQVLAWSSSDSFVDADGDGLSGKDDPKGPFPVAARLSLGEGAVNVVSDPSIMINSMVGREDNYRFIQYLTGGAGQERILVVRSHLTKAPLDASRIKLDAAREVVSSPYALVGIVALIFAVVSRYTLQKGETGG